ncbi:MAG: HAMP domain-containing histidine kinase [Bacteroidia bacterium]|nr:HAMP domain-containing histidine kinase [Bacteroidia bacterium]
MTQNLEVAMEEQVYRKGMPWLILGILLLLVSSIMYVYDFSRADSEIYLEVQSALQEDFRTILEHYETNAPPEITYDKKARATHLYYDAAGRLLRWSDTEFLPSSQHINRLSYFKNNPVWSIDKRAYYVVQHETTDETHIVLIPLHIGYNVENESLLPYFFMGRFHNLFYHSQATRNILSTIAIIGSSEQLAPVVIKDLENRQVLAYQQIPISLFRQRDRTLVLVLLVFAIVALCVYLRIFALERWDYRYFINISLFVGIILLRIFLWFANIPGDYLNVGLFSADVLAFNFLAPSLGEFTLNVFALVCLIWIAYMHFFRMSLILWHKVMKNHYLAWVGMLLVVALIMGMGAGYSSIFEKITNSSQVELEFSNIFSADLFAFLILLDMGLLFLVVILSGFMLFKLNILYGRKYGFTPAFWLIHVLGALVSGIAIYQEEWSLAITMVLAIGFLLVILKRMPFKPILHHDMINYLLMLGLLSIVVTVHFNKSLEAKSKSKAEQIADRVIGKQVGNTTTAFGSTLRKMEYEAPQINEAFEESRTYNAFHSWLKSTYFDSRMRDFDVQLFAFDSTNVRIDDSKNEPVYTPFSDLSPGEVGGEQIAQIMVGENFSPRTPADSASLGLFRLMNTEDRFVDFFVGIFRLSPSDSAPITYYLELRPNSRSGEGLYPSLTMDQRVYRDVQLINSVDHATYREGMLYYEQGASEFPLKLADYKNIVAPQWTTDGDYRVLTQPIGEGIITHVVVKYPMRGLLDNITTFSFIFYFFVLAGIVVIGLPVLAMRSLRSYRFTQNMPLRSKIRFGLLSISVLPMIFIMLLLSPFIYHRYENQAVDDLLKETERITALIGQDYLYFKNDAFSRMTLLQEFKNTVESMGEYLQNDVNIFDEQGKPLANSHPTIFTEDISTNLMNAEALRLLTSGETSDVVLKERIGTKEYFSGYRAIIGRNQEPVGFVNVPYLTKQQELDSQVIDFLAYLANIYLVVFLLINIVAVLISSTITQPLKMIQARLSNTGLGGKNERIEYEANDEIGSIVTAYNKMILQLEDNEEKIKQNQRELAWRQMARQVAHEIKNPLTPMRLSIQHLSRSWDLRSDKLNELFPKVMKTLMSQIDTMVRIANSFSEFAKMPETNKSKVMVNEVLHEVVNLFTQTDDLIWLIDIPEEQFFTFADRDQLSRSFNNILKNAIQAMEGSSGVIEVTMRNYESKTRIEIMDSGSGIPFDIQQRIFEPSFSTKNSGMGLGLSMVKKIIETSGGEITFASEEGKGTTFFIELPRMEEMIQLPVV